MRIPIPKNKIVGLTLIGALLTGLLAAGLAAPNLIQKQGQDENTVNPTRINSITQQTSNPPKPYQNFTPTVQRQSPYQNQYEEKEEYEEESEIEDEDEEREEYEDEEYNEY